MPTCEISPSEYPRRAPAAVPRIRPAKTAGPESPSSSVVGGRRDLRPLRNFDEEVVTAPAIATAHKRSRLSTFVRPRGRAYADAREDDAGDAADDRRDGHVAQRAVLALPGAAALAALDHRGRAARRRGLGWVSAQKTWTALS